ncbi:MAG: hypothetical protein M3367_05235 [Acidobacteriota bacterium]|nr:hypothetical protein [Acidobacteriota bacterium]
MKIEFMNITGTKLLLFFSITFFVLLNSQNILGQNPVENINSEKSKAELVDSFQWANGDEANARLDALWAKVQNNPNSIAYIIIYCGKICKYGEVEAHIKGIELAIAFRNFPRDKVVIISGGFRENTTTELWLLTEKSCPPTPKPTINIRDVKFQKTKKPIFRPYDCCY